MSNNITFASSRKQNGDNYISLMYWVLLSMVKKIICGISFAGALLGCLFIKREKTSHARECSAF